MGSLGDLLGYPTGVQITAAMRASALPFHHYANIYNYHYRDSQLQTELTIDYGNGEDTTTSRDLKRPAWKRDYFTKCRPEPQLGPEIVIPLGEQLPVLGIGVKNTANFTASGAIFNESDGTAGSGANWALGGTNDFAIQGNNTTKIPDIYVDLAEATGLPVTAFREANATQRWQEANNIYGGRYMEQLMARFGVLPEDSRMQWPEFLGSGTTKIQFSEVLATAEGTNLDVGDMKGHGIAVVGSNQYKYRVKEHGYCMVFMILRPKTQYFQGLPRHLSRQTKFDYLLPEFVAIGDQAVLNKEIYAAGAAPNDVFGYTPIYEEYCTIPSRVAGDFKTTLKYWHMAREFSSAPALNSDFITCTPTSRVFPDTTGPQIYVNSKHTLHAHRPLPKSPGIS